jgi:DNA adenine methylase
MAAITIATANKHKAERFFINDLNAALVNLLKTVTQNPDELIAQYTAIWNEQFSYSDDHIQHFYFIRDRFNAGEQMAAYNCTCLQDASKGLFDMEKTVILINLQTNDAMEQTPKILRKTSMLFLLF